MSSLASSIRTFSRPLDRRLVVAGLAIAAVLAAIVLAVGVGPVDIGPATVWEALLPPAGGGVVAVAGLVFFPGLPFKYVEPMAFVGGVVSGGLAYTMAWRGGTTPARLALAGIAVTSMLTAVIAAMLITSSFSAQIGLRWIIGGLLGRKWGGGRG